MPAPSLEEVQRWMVSRILPPERSGMAGVEVELNPQAGDPGAERLGVYSGGYLARMEEALEEAYPAVRHVAGRKGFHVLAHDYAARYPSRSYNLSRAGLHLPEFLKTHPLSGELPFLPDLARLEWAVAEAFHAFDHPPLDPARLSAIPAEDWGRIRLGFQPSLRFVASAWPILDIWEARNRPVAEVHVDLIGRPQRVMVFRQALQVRCELLDEPQETALRALLSGKSIGELPDLVPDWFSRWAAAGLIVDINT
ncbi:MAG: DNA-binding domain-containing protein [Candidatus Omnitrophota bacterium]|nr:DNA-binding domain-containing protein [Candidatus Omnitrophota bacterium]